MAIARNASVAGNLVPFPKIAGFGGRFRIGVSPGDLFSWMM